MKTLETQIADLEAKLVALKSQQAAAPAPRKAKAAKVIEVRDIKDRDHVRAGETFPGTVKAGQNADIVKGKSIRLFGVETNRAKGPLSYDRTFKVGDIAVYDSYNLYYTNEITAIGAKTVSIAGKRLSIYEFNFYNNTMDLDAVKKHNDIEHQCI